MKNLILAFAITLSTTAFAATGPEATRAPAINLIPSPVASIACPGNVAEFRYLPCHTVRDGVTTEWH